MSDGSKMELWVVITIGAAFMQNIRSALQKYLKDKMSTTGATFVRFGFGLPFALCFWLVSQFFYDGAVPILNARFFFWASVAAVAQIAATFLLIYLFSFRNFTVGTAYSRTEPAQTALFALLFFGEKLHAGGLVAIAVSIAGVILISVARTAVTFWSLATAITSRTALIGLGSGTLFGVAAVGYRAAALSIEGVPFFMQAATTLCFAIFLQTVLMLLWLYRFERSEFARIAAAWRPALITGMAGAIASFGWFTAFTLQQAALVKVVAQIEMLFTFASSILFFHERINRLEVLGCLLITGGIVLLLLWG